MNLSSILSTTSNNRLTGLTTRDTIDRGERIVMQIPVACQSLPNTKPKTNGEIIATGKNIAAEVMASFPVTLRRIALT